MSSAMPIAVVIEANAERLDEDAGHQVLAVGAAARERDRAAEDEREQQHEHDRLEDREDRELRDPRHPLQVAPGRRSGRRRRRRGARSCALPPRRSRSSSSAAWPVSVEEDVVERRPAQRDVVDPDPGSPSRRTTSTSCVRAAVGRDRDPPRVLVDRGAAVGREQLVPRARSSCRLVDDDLDALAADLRLELVGRAAGDDPARGRRPRSRRRARRPPRGTASSGAASRPRAPARGSRPTSRGGCAGRGRSSARRGRGACGRPISALARSSRRRMPPE